LSAPPMDHPRCRQPHGPTRRRPGIFQQVGRLQDRKNRVIAEDCGLVRLKGERGIAGLAATYSSAPRGAVPSARRVFTAEFGMGSGVWPLAMATRPARPAPGGLSGGLSCAGEVSWSMEAALGFCRYARRRRVQAPIERLVPVSCAGCPASTSGLSTWWSTTALRRDLVLRRVSRLDAFSGYPVRT
jgi:hypothetical protein